MNIYQRFIRWWGTKRSFTWVGRHLVTPIDSARRGHGRSITDFGTDFPLCYLTTTGRKSGRTHVVPLLYGGEPASPVVTGTNFGGAAHPAWALNLLHEPRAMLQIGAEEVPVMARLLEGEELRWAWSELTAIWPGFEGYVERSGRAPLTFALEPVRF